MVGRARTMGAGACIGALLTLALVGCGGGDSTPVASTTTGPASSGGPQGIVIPFEVRLDTTDPSHQATLMVGDTLELRLETEPDSGYVWTVTKKPDKSILKGSGVGEQVPASPVPGTVTIQVFTYAALAKGKTMVVVSYAKPSGGNQKRVGNFRVVVE